RSRRKDARFQAQRYAAKLIMTGRRSGEADRPPDFFARFPHPAPFSTSTVNRLVNNLRTSELNPCPADVSRSLVNYLPLPDPAEVRVVKAFSILQAVPEGAVEPDVRHPDDASGNHPGHRQVQAHRQTDQCTHIGMRGVVHEGAGPG